MFEDFPEELQEICDEYSITEEELSQFMEAIKNKLNEDDIKSEMLDADIEMSLLRLAVENYYSHPEYQQPITQEDPNLEKSVNIAFTKKFPEKLDRICNEYSITEEELSQFMKAIENKLTEAGIKLETFDDDILKSLLKMTIDIYYSQLDYNKSIPRKKQIIEEVVNIAFLRHFPEYSYNDDLEIPKRR